MPVLLLPDFIADLQSHAGTNFARRVLQKTLHSDGRFRPDTNDHRYQGIDGAWIRYVSGKRTAYRVIYLRDGDTIYLYRAGEHHIEDRLVAPRAGATERAVCVDDAWPPTVPRPDTTRPPADGGASNGVADRFRRNVPTRQIYGEIFSRRILPHKDIWLVAPYVDTALFAPTARFGKLLLDQVEDGARVVLITRPPADEKIDWMERLAERRVGIYVYPKLHTKLYCFILDDERDEDASWRYGNKRSSLILVGSANLTVPGMAVDDRPFNEELCYVVPEAGIDYVERYMIELMSDAYELPDVRRLKARGMWQQMENTKW